MRGVDDMVTVREVAKDAGVSLGTVSKVINGIPVSDANYNKVITSVRKLGYQVNIYAQNLKSHKNNAIAVIVPNLANPYYALWVHHMELALSRSAYRLLLCVADGKQTKEMQCFESARQNRVSGIIGLIGDGVSEKEVEKTLEDFPLITLDRDFGEKCHCVTSDNYEGGRLAAKKLFSTMEQGKKLLYIENIYDTFGEPKKRQFGFTAYCEENGVPYEIFNIGNMRNVFKAGEVIHSFLEAHTGKNGCEFDGIFVSRDDIGVAIIKQLSQLKLRVPEDVQVIGFDGLRMFNAGDYYLSSIRQPIELISKKCVENVIKLINKEEVPQVTALPVSFVNGGTTR